MRSGVQRGGEQQVHGARGLEGTRRGILDIDGKPANRLAHVLRERQELDRHQGQRQNPRQREGERLSPPRQVPLLNVEQSVGEDHDQPEGQHLWLPAEECDAAQDSEQEQQNQQEQDTGARRL